MCSTHSAQPLRSEPESVSQTFFLSQNPFKLKIEDSKECLFMGLKLPILEIKVEKKFKTSESMVHIPVPVSAVMSLYILWLVSHCAVTRDRKKGQAGRWHLVALVKASRRENLGGHQEGALERKEQGALPSGGQPGIAQAERNTNTAWRGTRRGRLLEQNTCVQFRDMSEFGYSLSFGPNSAIWLWLCLWQSNIKIPNSMPFLVSLDWCVISDTTSKQYKNVSNRIRHVIHIC